MAKRTPKPPHPNTGNGHARISDQQLIMTPLRLTQTERDILRWMGGGEMSAGLRRLTLFASTLMARSPAGVREDNDVTDEQHATLRATLAQERMAKFLDSLKNT